MPESKPWKPVLEGEDAARAITVVREIAEALKDDSEVADPSLASGKAGIALFYAYLDQAFPQEGHGETAFRYLQGAIEGLPALGPYPALFGGITGIAWTAEHLSGVIFDPGDEDPNSEVDEMLSALVGQSPWTGDYDLVSGLVGFGVYALERMPRPKAREILESIVLRLEEMAEHHKDGITWLTRPEILPEQHRKNAPNGYYNLGVAHGVPGVAYLLAAVVSAKVAEARARPLLADCMKWILAQKLPNSPGASFPAWVGAGIESQPSRSAWCYGDPGVAASMWVVGRNSSNESWMREATRLALATAARPMDEAGVIDAGICHGASGLGLILGQSFRPIDGNLLVERSRSWLNLALDLRRPGEGISGFQSWDQLSSGELGWKTDRGILMGAAGVGIALLSSASSLGIPNYRFLAIS